MKKRLSFLLIFHLLITSVAYAQNTKDHILVANFSAEEINSITPANWEVMKFDSIKRQTAYFLARDKNRTILKAVSNASASGYIRKISINPENYPILTWQWKIDNLIKRSNMKTRQGDDYPARIYISFDYDIERLTGAERFKIELYKSIHAKYPPLATLNYVWDSKNPVGYTTPNAYTNRVQMLVAQSGKAQVGQWVTQTVNIYEDYKRVFGETPMKVTAVAIMTDTDNTGESVTAYYGNIYFSKKR